MAPKTSNSLSFGGTLTVAPPLYFDENGILNIEVSSPEPPEPPISSTDIADGYAKGTTGGADGETVIITSTQQWNDYKGGNDPRILIIDAEISIGNYSKVGSNKTILGTSNGKVIGNIRIEGVTNVIVKNVKGTSSAADQDCIGVVNSTYVWINHCTFTDWTDGGCDVTKGSNYITISWCDFLQTRQYDHALAVLIGADKNDPDNGKLKTTLHHNRFGHGVFDRCPFGRWGEIHVYNNLYDAKASYSSPTSYVTAAYNAKILSQNNVFKSGEDPYIKKETGGLINCSGDLFHPEVMKAVTYADGVFVPPYEYTLDAVTGLEEKIIAGVGAR